MLKISISTFFCLISILCQAQTTKENSNNYLIVLDIQEVYMQNLFEKDSADRFIHEINSSIAKFPEENVIYIQTIIKALSIGSKGFSTDTIPGLNLDSRLKIVNNNIYTKEDGNAFSNPELINFLHSRKVDEIMIIGLLAERCVSKTLLGGIKCNYRMSFNPNSIAGKSVKSKLKSLNKLKKKGAIEKTISTHL